jgi:hypothetical protein
MVQLNAKNCHIVEIGMSLLAHAFMPLKFWDGAFLAAAYLFNRLPSRVTQDNTPLERMLDKKSDYTLLRTFGCAYWPYLRPYNSRKLQLRSKQCIFLGYSDMHKCYKCLDVSTGHVYISRDVVFDEEVFPFSKLYPNAGARLKSEIALLHPTLFHPHDGDKLLYGHVPNTPLTTLEVAEFQENM